MIAIVNFRTMKNGAFKYMSGMRRGYWRVLVVRELSGSTAVNSRNVVAVLYSGPDGIDGVTDRSAYHIGHSRMRADKVATAWNVARLGANIARVYDPRGMGVGSAC